MNLNERYNLAGTHRALEELGLTKEALVWDVAKGLFGAARKPIEWAFGRLGKSTLRMGQTAGLPAGATTALSRIGKGMGRDAATGGLLMGGFNAAMAEPGQGWEGFQRGFAGGALGGAGYRAGSNIARKGIGLAAGGRKGLMPIARARSSPVLNPETNQLVPQRSWFGGFRHGTGQGFKQLGANALLGGVPFAAGVGASMLMPTFEQDPEAQQTQQYGRAALPLILGS